MMDRNLLVLCYHSHSVPSEFKRVRLMYSGYENWSLRDTTPLCVDRNDPVAVCATFCVDDLDRVYMS